MDIENIDTENACIIGNRNECTFGYIKGVVCLAPRTCVIKFVHIIGKSPNVEIVFFFYFCLMLLLLSGPPGFTCRISFVRVFSFIY